MEPIYGVHPRIELLHCGENQHRTDVLSGPFRQYRSNEQSVHWFQTSFVESPGKRAEDASRVPPSPVEPTPYEPRHILGPFAQACFVTVVHEPDSTQ